MREVFQKETTATERKELYYSINWLEIREKAMKTFWKFSSFRVRTISPSILINLPGQQNHRSWARNTRYPLWNFQNATSACLSRQQHPITGKGDGFLQKTLIWKSISSKFCGTVTLKQSGYNHPMKHAERHKWLKQMQVKDSCRGLAGHLPSQPSGPLQKAPWPWEGCCCRAEEKEKDSTVAGTEFYYRSMCSL